MENQELLKLDENEINKIKKQVRRFMDHGKLRNLTNLKQSYSQNIIDVENQINFEKKQLEFQENQLKEWKEQYKNKNSELDINKNTYIYCVELIQEGIDGKKPIIAEEKKLKEIKKEIINEVIDEKEIIKPKDYKNNIALETTYFQETGSKPLTPKGNPRKKYLEWSNKRG